MAASAVMQFLLKETYYGRKAEALLLSPVVNWMPW
jgi:hypothetical protein